MSFFLCPQRKRHIFAPQNILTISMKLSIIIPVYNAEKYIYACLKSLAQQTADDFEVIIVNDGSTDKSTDICQHFCKKHPTKFSLYEISNSGPSIARNTGLLHARGEYITFIDADDWVEPCYVETILQEMAGVDLLYFGQSHHQADGSIASFAIEDTSATSPEDIEDLLLRLKSNETGMEIFGFTWNKCFRHDLIKKYDITFEQKLSVREDELFTEYYCRKIKQLKTISQVLYHYRVQNAGLTRKTNTPEEVLLLAEKLKDAVEHISSPTLYQYVNERIFNYYFIASMGMPLRKALALCCYLHLLYHQHVSKMQFKHSTIRLVFSPPPIISQCIFCIVWSLRHKRYRGI